MFKVKSEISAPKVVGGTTNQQQTNNVSYVNPAPVRNLKTIRQGEILGTSMIQRNHTEVNVVTTTNISEREQFSQEALTSVIAQVLEKIKSRQLFYAAINNAKITLDGEIINIGVISNADLKTLTSSFREWFKNELRTQLHNGFIEIVYTKQEMNNEVKLQTETELFNDYMKENPLFKKLVEGLELELV